LRNLVAALALAIATVLGVSGPVAAADISTAKVVIIVGATHGATAGYRANADQAYAEAIKYTSRVTKVYSPNATWAKVKAATAGANIVIYFGHGNGWPSPYTFDPTYSTKDGMGLNADLNGDGKLSDYENKYYGEPYMAQLGLAPNAIVLLHNLCYASGNSEPGNPAPTVSVAHQRIDNYGAGFLKGNARAVIADGHMGPESYLRDLFTTSQSIDSLWRSQPNYHNHEVTFASTRSPGYTVYSDPDTTSGGYYRSLVTKPTLTTGAVIGTAGDTGADPGSPVVRQSDVNRYATAATISRQTAPVNVPVVYIATGLNFPDALAAAAAAGHLDAPILLVQPSSIPEATKTELTRLKPGKIIVAGGTGVVSDDVLNQLAADPNPPNGVERQSGGDRYATAAGVSSNTFAPGVPVAYVATGQNFPDALAAAAAAGSLGGPVLLVTKTSIPEATATELDRLKPGRIVVAGGTGVVSSGVLAALDGYTGGAVERQSGANRYATAANISSRAFAPGVPVVYIATGLNFPDALAAAAAAGGLGGPVLLVGSTTIPSDTAAELNRLKPARIVVAGGTGVVSDGVQSQLAAYLAP
jgi:putative cell wall-binding protein